MVFLANVWQYLEKYFGKNYEGRVPTDVTCTTRRCRLQMCLQRKPGRIGHQRQMFIAINAAKHGPR